MLSFTSMGGKVDHSVLDGRGPYTFRINGENYHRIGALLPSSGQKPKFAQLYVYDTEHEIRNRINAVVEKNSTSQYDVSIVSGLQTMLDNINPYVRVFRMARDALAKDEALNFHIRIIERRDEQQYNRPTSSEVAALILGDGTEDAEYRDIIVCTTEGYLKRINEMHPSYMPLQYPLLFPYGEDGWRKNIPITVSPSHSRKTVSIREFYAFRLQFRSTEGTTLLQGGRLFQQFVVDCYAAIEQERLNWVRFNQDKLRSDLYKGLEDAITAGDVNASAVGRRFILPSSFNGGLRNMIQHYQDAMAICRCKGPPDLFITFTCNPRIPAIQQELARIHGQRPKDRPDIVSRVFRIMLKQLMFDLKKINIFGQVIAELWERHWMDLTDDMQYKSRRDTGEPDLSLDIIVQKNMGLNEIEQILNKNGRSLKEFTGMLMPSLENTTVLLNRLIREELSFDADLEKQNFEILHSDLNEEQQNVFHQVVESYIHKKCGVFFVYGSGGTGKTYLWKTLIAHIRANKKIVLSVASSGIAVLLLPGGRTAHSRFKIPLNLDETSCCPIAHRTDLAKLIQEADLLLWDEAPMTNRHAFEAVNRTFQDLMEPLDSNASNKAFGGKTVVLGGDFRQILPVIRKGTCESIVALSLQRSSIWNQCHVLKLHTNMRVMSTTITEEQRVEMKKFAQWILDVGDGRVPAALISSSEESNWIQISNEFLIDNTNDGLNHLIESIFSDLRNRYLDWLYLQERSILAPKNIDVDEINSILLSMLPVRMDYETFDRIHPYKSSWTIKVRVSRVFDVYEYNNAKGYGKLLKIILIDEKATLFNSDVDKFSSILEEESAYFITNVKVVDALTKFQVISHKYQLNFTNETSIHKIEDACSEISARKYNFKEFKSLRGLLNSEESNIDIIGVIVAVNPSIEYDDELLHAMGNHVVLVATSLLVREFQGDIYLSSTISTLLKFEPSIPEAKRILEWLHVEGGTFLLKSSYNGTYVPVSKFPPIEDRVSIDDLISKSSVCPSQATFYTIKGTIVRVDTTKPYWYKACIVCKKKIRVDGESTTCISCNITNPSVIFRFCVKVDVQDFSTQASFVMFNKEAEYLLGCTSLDFHDLNLLANESNDLDMKLMSCLMKEYWFQIRLAPENHRFITMQGFTVSNIEEYKLIEPEMKLIEKQYKRQKKEAKGTSSCNESSILSRVSDRGRQREVLYVIALGFCFFGQPLETIKFVT
ncbi:hypothetical protein HHK36_016538 [Tetracentron sinense]|uniref:ATP-dependent DNA helicase n=1 Tax=Tetracentron sinense TaxID=13715 RepID=A0A835DBL0_TETSI|nr:hypothetical protein HHK36_016538 [Tetracentron sinense]